jgi:Brp/Blh family beta-carotene 15,15'-monooxygenase
MLQLSKPSGLRIFARPSFVDSSVVAKEDWPARSVMFSLAALSGLSWLGVDLAGSTATLLFCFALLLIGLPHGTFDFYTLKRSAGHSLRRLAVALAYYVALAAITLLLWQLSSVVSLAIFLVISVFHFSEDWMDLRSGGAASESSIFLALSIPLSLIALPALSHPDMLRAIFVGLAGANTATWLVDGLMLMAPVAVCVAIIRIVVDWQDGETSRAVTTAMLLLSMVLLPPVAGFAIYFCLAHSPRHFRNELNRLKRFGQLKWIKGVALLTLIAGSGALGLLVFQTRLTVTDSVSAATFITLSVLTVPHILVPLLIRHFQRLSVARD